MNTKLTAKASIGILQPIQIVFEAITHPEIMSNYFISHGTGKLESGKEVHWEFPESEGSFPIYVKEITANEFLSFVWDPKSLVKIKLEKLSETITVVKVLEEGYQLDEEGLKWVVEQTEGWANFLACMKAWLEHGIHLRKGAFDFRKHD